MSCLFCTSDTKTLNKQKSFREKVLKLIKSTYRIIFCIIKYSTIMLI